MRIYKISYKKLWKLLIDKDITVKQMLNSTNISSATISKMKRSKNINTDVIVKICRFFECNISDICEIERIDYEE
ncbi:helix-turn-helix domain-containing protein [Mycoplasma aquilae ATCC BAA-1896]|uniref:helix-turn-helix domain-containing protein n=1 Tax=Mycoplasma aquilae TaxID=1312741 RepID=UPI003A84B1BE